MLQIILDLEKHNVDPETLFRSTLIDCLTSQYLVGTRGKDGDVTSKHFTRDSPDTTENDEKGQEVGNPRNWLSRRILDQSVLENHPQSLPFSGCSAQRRAASSGDSQIFV